MCNGPVSTNQKQFAVIVSLHLLPSLFYPNNANKELAVGKKKGVVSDKQRCEGLLIKTSRSYAEKQRGDRRSRSSRRAETLQGLAVLLTHCATVCCVCVCERSFQGLSPSVDSAKSPCALPLVNLSPSRLSFAEGDFSILSLLSHALHRPNVTKSSSSPRLHPVPTQGNICTCLLSLHNLCTHEPIIAVC